MFNMRGRHFLSIGDYTSEEIRFILGVAKQMKERYYSGERIIPVLKGKHLLLIFEKPSTRTRISFEVAMKELGGDVIALTSREMQISRGETLADTARVISRYVDGVAARVYSHKSLVELSKYSSIPVINALSDLEHPMQAVGDMLTILEKKGRVAGLKISFLGDGADNVLHSLMLAAAKLGASVWVGTAKGYEPNPEILKAAMEEAQLRGAEIVVTHDPVEAVKDADVVYTDVWVSMGQEAEKERRIRELSPYQVNRELMIHAKRDAIFMHCLPAHRGYEVTDDVIDGPWSVVWDQAENRLHAQKAVLSLLL